MSLVHNTPDDFFKAYPWVKTLWENRDDDVPLISHERVCVFAKTVVQGIARLDMASLPLVSELSDEIRKSVSDAMDRMRPNIPDEVDTTDPDIQLDFATGYYRSEIAVGHMRNSTETTKRALRHLALVAQWRAELLCEIPPMIIIAQSCVVDEKITFLPYDVYSFQRTYPEE